MKRRPWWNPSLGAVSICIVLLGIHTVLRLVLAEYDVVSTIFAAGDHVPVWMLLCASFFVVIRLCVLLLIPGLLAWRISTWVVKSLNQMSARAR
ncbi:MAG: hypothetical protein PVH02_14060 [Desulfobacteraceae bacterium]